MSAEDQPSRWASVTVIVVVWVLTALAFVPFFVASMVADMREARLRARAHRDAEQWERWRRGKGWRKVPRVRSGFRVPGR